MSVRFSWLRLFRYDAAGGPCWRVVIFETELYFLMKWRLRVVIVVVVWKPCIIPQLTAVDPHLTGEIPIDRCNSDPVQPIADFKLEKWPFPNTDLYRKWRYVHIQSPNFTSSLCHPTISMLASIILFPGHQTKLPQQLKDLSELPFSQSGI